MDKISAHISYKEATASQTATRKGISNDPNADQLKNMQEVAYTIFEPVRAHFGKPIFISSFFRSPDLNTAIGGSSTSQHCKGEAIDIDGDRTGVSNKEIFDYIRKHLVFDQLIWEFGDDNSPNWVHVSYTNERENRKQVLIAKKINGRTFYTPYENI